MLEVEVRDLATENNAGDTGEVIVQPRPDTGVHDFLPQIVRHVEVAYRVEIPIRPGRVESVDIEVDAAGP